MAAARKSRAKAKPSKELEVAAAGPVKVASERVDQPAALAVREATPMRATGDTHTIRTTMRPGDEITVDDDEYLSLLDQGVIYDGTPPDPVADPFDARVAEFLAVDGSSTQTAVNSIVTSAVTGAQDPYVAGLVGDTGSETSAALRAALVARGGNTFDGVQSSPFLEVDNASQQTSIHLVLLPGFTGAYGLGIGINADDAKGLVLDATNPGTMAAQITLFPGTDAASFGLSMQNQGAGTLLDLAQQGDGTVNIGPALHVESQGVAAAGQILARFQADALAGTSGWGADILVIYADTGAFNFTGPHTVINGGLFTVETENLAQDGNVHRIDIDGAKAPSIDIRAYSGSPGQFFTQGIVGQGQHSSLRAADGAPTIGAESWTDVVSWGNVSSATVLGFHGATPIARPVLATGAGHTVDDVIAILQSYGLLSQS